MTPSITQLVNLPARMSCRLEDLRRMRDQFEILMRDTKDLRVTAEMDLGLLHIDEAIGYFDRAYNIAAYSASLEFAGMLERKI